jgi:hypothetical protein
MIFRVRQDKAHQYHLVQVVDLGNQAVLVPTDIEYRASAYWIGVREIAARFGQMVPPRSARDPPPIFQRLPRISMPLPELSQFLFADNMHRLTALERSMLSN